MGEYTFRTFRKLLCATLVFSLLWPDVARCMQDDEEKDSQSSPPKILSKNISDLKEKKSSSENLKIEVEVKEEIKEIPPQTETIQEKKEPIQSLLPKQENVTEKNTPLTEAKPKEEELKNTKTIETNPSHDPKKKEEKENQDTQLSNNSSQKSNPEIPDQIIEEGFSSDKVDIITTKENKRNDYSLDYYLLLQEKKPNPPCSCFKGIFNCCTKKKVEMKSIFSEKSPLLINEDSIEEDSEKNHVQDKIDKRETPSQIYARLLNLDLEKWESEEQTAWKNLLKVEGTWRNPLIWANLETLIHKALFALTTNKSAITKKKGEKAKKCCDPLWLYGGPVPLKDSSTLTRNVTFKTLGNAFQDGVADTIETILTGLLGYQVYELFHSGTWKLLTFKTLVEFYEGADNTSYIAVINTLSEHPALFALFAIPIGFAALKTLWNVSHVSKPTKGNINKTIESIEARSPKWGSKFFSVLSIIPSVSSLLIFHPTKSDIPGLALSILWKGDLSTEDREEAFKAIVKLANDGKGITQMTAIESLKYLAHGMHVENLRNRPSGLEELAKIKARALHELKKVYKEKLHSLSINKIRTAMHLWEIGQSPSLAVSLIAPVIKAALAAFYGYSLYQLGAFLYDYFRCSNKYKTRFTWLESVKPGYVNDFNKDCFDEQVKVFNLIPGQPAYTLVGNKTNNLLTKYRFPNKTYDLDLSNKNINGSVIADIVEAFQNASARVSLRSLNIAHNIITNSSDIERILAALPSSITNLNMSYVDHTDNGFSINSFSRLGYLTGLQSLDVSRIAFSSYHNNVIGQILQNLFQLRELRLRWLYTNLTQVAQALKPSLQLLDLSCHPSFNALNDEENQIALGMALQNPFLHLRYLYLENMNIGNSSQGNIELAQGLRAQTNLKVLDLSDNELGYSSNVNVHVLLRSLPFSLTSLDVSVNPIGSQDSFEVTELSRAVKNMSGLIYFKAGGQNHYFNALGKSSDFLQALHHKQNLAFLDLSRNFFNDTTQMSNLLNTTLNLEILNLSNNQLTNGSLLAPVLSTLRKLKILNLGGNNNFTTSDRMAIWNATSSFLSKSPFPLDDDLNYAASYLQDFPFNTTTLNFAGLVPNNSTAFETIMPIVVNRFTNLQNLDLSNNEIMDRDPITRLPHTKGIEALIQCLPHLTHLQSLTISNSFADTYSQESVICCQKFSQAIGQLKTLYFLDLSGSGFFYIDSLGKGLNKSYSLTSINLGNCGSTDQWQEGVQLIKGLQAHPNLTDLDLSSNPIGGASPNSTYALANALSSWPQLQSLNLAENWIGYADPESSSYFLKKLAELAITVNNKTGKTLDVNLVDGIYNITWTNEAGVFQNLTEQSILKACARQLCSGGNITQPKTKAHSFQEERRVELVKKDPSLQKGLSIKPTTTTHQLQEVQVIETVTSSASHLAPFYQPLISSVKSWFSVKSWSVWGDEVLDSMANAILSYSQQVVENAPGYYSGTLDKSKSPAEGRNKTFRNYPIPHFRAIDQGEPLDVRRFNHMQALPQAQGFSYTTSSLMVSTGSQPLMLPN